MKDTTTSIKDITKKVIRNLTKENTTKKQRAERVWRKAAGKRFDKHTQPVSFRRKRLVVNVDSSGWLYELAIIKQYVVRKLKKDLKGEFKELQLRIGEIEK